MSIKIKTYQGTVYPWHCDHMGHMNVQFYVSMFDQASWSYFSQLGLTLAFFRESKKGMAALEQNVKYKRELLPGHNILIETRLLEIREKVIRLHHTMINMETGEVAAECELIGIHLDTEKRKGIPFPAFVTEKVKELITLQPA